MTTVITPDLGDIESAEIIEVIVKIGDEVHDDTPVCVVESDKASMEIPAQISGTVSALRIAVGDKVKGGDPLIEVEPSAPSTNAHSTTDESQSPREAVATPKQPTTQTQPSVAPTSASAKSLVVIGAGPGGYAAAFRAADLGLNVSIVEQHSRLGGVCLNVGCIPSKALLHTAKLINETKAAKAHGVDFGAPKIDIDAIRDHKNSVVDTMTGGLTMMAKRRGVKHIQGRARFTSANEIMVEHEGAESTLHFDQAIIAAGSRVVKLPFFPWDDPRVMDSTDALELAEIPKRLLVVGGGIIGLEMGTVYAALGASVDIVELTDGLMAGADIDLARVFTKYNKDTFNAVYLNTEVTAATANKKGIKVSFKGDKAPENETYDRVLVAVGRRPNSDRLNIEAAGVNVDARGFISVDRQMRTNVDHIFAIGDIVGQPMLAHKATHEGHVAAEVCAGHKVEFIASVIPSVAYTDPEVAWVGLTEIEAKAKNIDYDKASFPWAASGRATSIGRNEGSTKLIFDPTTNRVLGGGIVGVGAGDLIGEVALAIEMGADAHDIGLTIHPHPTLTETVGMAAETYLGSVTDIIAPKKRKK